MKNLILLGMMGVGKTTLGKVVAKKRALKFFDTDELIEKKLGMEIVEIFVIFATPRYPRRHSRFHSVFHQKSVRYIC